MHTVKTSTVKAKLGIGCGVTKKSTPFIDKYVAFLEAQGRKFDDIAEYKNKEYGAILVLQGTLPPINEQELADVLDTYISLHTMAALTGEFYYPSPSSFYKHFYEIIDSFHVQQKAKNDVVQDVIIDDQTKEQIEFLLEQLSILWGEEFPYEKRVQLVARSYAAFDRFVALTEFQKLPDSIKSQFSRYQTVRNFYRYIELHPKITDIQKSPVLTMGYLRTLVNKQLPQDKAMMASAAHSSRRIFKHKKHE